MTNERYDRNIRFFGREGQERLAAATVAVVGIGGLGTHVVQQLALLGIGRIFLIDHEELDDTNRNRYVGVRHDDPVPGTSKVTIGVRVVSEANPAVDVVPIPKEMRSPEAFAAIRTSDYVFGCLDHDGPRLILTELCSAYSRPYFDLASDISADGSTYGGRAVATWDGGGCLMCYGELDSRALQLYFAGGQREDHAAIYGVPLEELDETGPSVVSINGVVASLGVTEFMLVVAGVKDAPRRLTTYRANMGIVTLPPVNAPPDCYYCSGLRGKGDAAGVDRYLPQEVQAS